MNRRKKSLIITLIAFLVLLPLLQVKADDEAKKEWGISIDQLKKNITGTPYTEFSPDTTPNYENKILNYIIAIDNNFKSKTKVIQLSNSPVCDYLFVKNKLYSVKNDFGSTTAKVFNDKMAALTKVYGMPAIQQDSSMTTHSFADENTKVLVISSKKQNNIEFTVYYYPAKLFKMLMID